MWVIRENLLCSLEDIFECKRLKSFQKV